jgi:hypothetical protein
MRLRIFSAVLAFAFSSVAVAQSQAECAKVLEVAVFADRVHIKCQENYFGEPYFDYFAVPTSNSDEANRLLQIGLFARQNSTSLTVLFNFAAGNEASYGCDPSNCRRPVGFKF